MGCTKYLYCTEYIDEGRSDRMVGSEAVRRGGGEELIGCRIVLSSTQSICVSLIARALSMHF